ncbi:MAG: hypothetical protein OEV08_10750, partial [Nitrospira sp.]|nr:hypothetical protein [Nitrospira sp.]
MSIYPNLCIFFLPLKEGEGEGGGARLQFVIKLRHHTPHPHPDLLPERRKGCLVLQKPSAIFALTAIWKMIWVTS